MTQKANFLNKDQKQVKADIMVQCLNSIFSVFGHDLFTDEISKLDCITSVLFMLNREVIIHLYSIYQLDISSDQFIEHLATSVKQEVKEHVSRVKTQKEKMN